MIKRIRNGGPAMLVPFCDSCKQEIKCLSQGVAFFNSSKKDESRGLRLAHKVDCFGRLQHGIVVPGLTRYMELDDHLIWLIHRSKEPPAAIFDSAVLFQSI